MILFASRLLTNEVLLPRSSLLHTRFRTCCWRISSKLKVATSSLQVGISSYIGGIKENHVGAVDRLIPFGKTEHCAA